MSRKSQEISHKKEQNKYPINNQKFSIIKKNGQNPSNQINKPSINNNNNQKQLNINTQNHSFFDNKIINTESNQKNDINNNYQFNQENKENNANNNNLIDSETYIIDDNIDIEKPPNALEINDLLGEKCDLDLDILSINFTNFEASKTSLKSMGIIKAYGANTYQGLVRNYNEDRVSIIINMAKPKNFTKAYWPKTSFFGIYDGHGGSICSEFLRDSLHKLILNDTNYPENVELAIKNGFLNAEKTFLNKYAIDPNDDNNILDRSGSCAVIVLVVDKKIYVANVGDSRALFSEKKGKNFVVVTEDHKPNNINERNRIIKNGGHVYQSKTVISGAENENLNGQILFGPYRVLPGRLSVSRTIGDIEAKSEKFGGNHNVIIWEPDIFIYDLNKTQIDFFIMGCDGIFDQMSNEEIMECAWIILNNNTNNETNKNINNNGDESYEYNFENCNIHEKCGLIVDFIVKASMVRKSFDNVTCLMIAFDDFIPKEKNNKETINSLSTDEYLKNIYKLNNSTDNKLSSHINPNTININQPKRKSEIHNRSKELTKNDYNSGNIEVAHKNINNKINNKYKEMPKNLGKANLKLTNFINSKNNYFNNTGGEYLPRTYRNINTDINENKKNFNTNNINRDKNKIYIKKRNDRNIHKKNINKTDDNKNNNLNKNISNNNIVNKSDIQPLRKNNGIYNTLNQSDINDYIINKKTKIKKKLEANHGQNEISDNNINHYIKNKNNNNSAVNNSLINKLKNNKIAKIPLELNNKLINYGNIANNNNNSLNVRFQYSNTYTNKYKKLPNLKTNSISNIPNITSNINHLTTTNIITNINSQILQKKFKNFTKPKTFRYNNTTSFNKYQKSLNTNKFFGKGNKTHYNCNSHNIHNISDSNNLINNNNNNNIIYSQNYSLRLKSGKDKENMTSRKKKYSFHKIIKSLSSNAENITKNKIQQTSNKKLLSYSKEKDLKNFLYKNKTNIAEKQNDNNKKLNVNNKYGKFIVKKNINKNVNNNKGNKF